MIIFYYRKEERSLFFSITEKLKYKKELNFLDLIYFENEKVMNSNSNFIILFFNP